MESIRVIDVGQVALPAGGTSCLEKLNRLLWTHGFSFSSHGVGISVRSNAPRYLDVLKTRLPTGAVAYSGSCVDVIFSLWVPPVASSPGMRHFSLLYQDDCLVARDLGTEHVVDCFSRHAQLAVAALVRDRVFVHAGVVGWKGRAAIFPGPSRSGKSELVRALLRLGATYYSDEYAIIGPSGQVEPYLRPLSMRRSGDGRSYTIAPERLGAHVGTFPMPIGLLLFSRYDPDAHWRPRRLSPAEAAVGLISNAVAAQIAPQLVLHQVTALSRVVPAFETPRGEAQQAAALVLEVLDDPAAGTDALRATAKP